MATHPIPEAVVSLPPVLAFALGVPVAPRSAVEAVIEKMIAALNEIDGDPEAKDMAWPEWTEWPQDLDVSSSEDDEDTHDQEEIDERELEDRL